jgi:hypothetical protein
LICSIDLQSLSAFHGTILLNTTTSLNCSVFDKGFVNGSISADSSRCVDPNAKVFLVNPPSSSTYSLTTGAKAGIVVGSVVGFLLCCGVAWYIIKRFRDGKQRRLAEQEGPPIPELSAEKADAELEASHGNSEMLGQGQASGHVDAFEMEGCSAKR